MNSQPHQASCHAPIRPATGAFRRQDDHAPKRPCAEAPKRQSSHAMAIRCLALALILLAASACASRQETPPPAAGDPLAALRTAIDAALGDSALARSRAGIKVVSLTSGEVLYERDSHLLFHPASNMKLLSTAIALQRLGTDYSYRTLVGTDSGAAVDSVVRGPLYLKGFGNPDLIDSDLRGLAETLRRDGIRRVDGPLVCDATYFDDLPWGYGWMWDDVSAWYWAPISALTVNDNCVEVTVAPGDSVGAPLNVSLVPETAFMAIDDLGSTVAPDDSAALEDFSVQRQWRPIAGNVVEITGGMAVGSRPRTWTIDVVDAPRYTGNRFLELLAAEGIAIRGGIEVDTMPESAQLLAEHRSEPLTDIVINTNKVSDNLSAEALLKSAGAAWQGPPGTAEGFRSHPVALVRRYIN